MPSGLLLGRGTMGCPRKPSASPYQDTVVVLREESVGAVLNLGAATEGAKNNKNRSHRHSSKRNATYRNDDEYDEDLAQLDILLHYVNNLSASLEFLKWEDQRISTDLVPTLLDMYDALYARLSESSCTSKEDARPILREEKTRNLNDAFVINEVDKINKKCVSCEQTFVLGESQCQCSCASENLKAAFQSLKPVLKIEHDYDIPESIEKPPDERGRTEFSFNSQSVVTQTSSIDGSPLISRDLVYRPVSSISSSSSESSNSLLRRPIGTLASYLASAESLEDHTITDSETSRRKDRGLKARREKALRTGSDDSGVQCHSISRPVPPTLRPRYCDPNLRDIDRVVLEILETEEIYVRDLNAIIEGYLNYWKSEPQSCISSQIADTLFSNIESIFQFNRGFLRELELCGTDPVLVAKCFVRNNEGFAIYTEYCTNYPRTVSILTDLMREESSGKTCRERQLSLGHTLPLGSYLLKPVQRILKYHLLLRNIVKHFDNDRPGYSHICNALSAMRGIAHHINDMKRKHEHAVRVQEIQSLLYGWQGEDLTTFGELAAEGAFRMFGVKGLRHVFLFDKLLVITKKKDENILMYKAHIMCSDLMLIESIPREPLSFHVIPFDNPKCQYTLECRNMDQKREWTSQLKRVILENYSATIPAHARQLVMELGQISPEVTVESRGGTRRAHCAPEYLEKRKGKRRASEGGLNSRLRIRRSSRTRKDKLEKESRSRSASRTRETDEENDCLSPSPSPGDKSRLRLPIWRRRSEPGMPGRLSLPTSNRENHSTDVNNIPENNGKSFVACENNFDALSSMGYESSSVYERDNENDAAAEENLEEIVSQLLQHQLQMQQNILNKQRRGLLRNKTSKYETSDDEADSHSLPPLPKSPPPLLTESIPFSNEYIDLLFKESESQWSSRQPSCASSTLSIHQHNYSVDSSTKSTSVSRSGSGISDKKVNLTNRWSPNTNRLTHFSKMETPSFDAEVPSNSETTQLRRNCSFNCELLDDANTNDTFDGQTSTKEDRERPITIAIYESPSNTSNFSVKSTEYDASSPKNHESYYSKNYSVDNLVNVHPEHKIYSKASVNRASIKRVLSRITNPRGSIGNTISEPSHSLSNLYSESGKLAPQKSSYAVSSMAKQCSKTLKQKMKQIRSDDVSSPTKGANSSIGARLATVSDDYAVPVIQSFDIRPDSVLSSSSLWTCSSSSSSSNKDSKNDDMLPCSVESDVSGDSFYEKSFEAIEALLEEEIFRDSAIYSETEDYDGHGLSPAVSFRSSSKRQLRSYNLKLGVDRSSDTALTNDLDYQTRSKKLPPPVPAKPDRSNLRPKVNLIQQQLKHLERNQSLQEERQTSVVSERKNSLDSSVNVCTSMGFSYSPRTNSFGILPEDDESIMTKGWVKHVIGKLQQ